MESKKILILLVKQKIHTNNEIYFKLKIKKNKNFYSSFIIINIL